MRFKLCMRSKHRRILRGENRAWRCGVEVMDEGCSPPDRKDERMRCDSRDTCDPSSKELRGKKLGHGWWWWWW